MNDVTNSRKSKKDFSKWHLLKSKIEEFGRLHFFHEREVWWCSLGANIGVEEDGKNDLFERPVIVVKKFSKELFWGIPLTTSKKEGPYYFPFSLHGNIGKAITSHLRTLSSKRLIRRIGKMGKKQFYEIVEMKSHFLGRDTKTAPFREPRVPSGNL